ncbi:MAG: DUF2807 domain-containing protein [Candidatus Paceibacterota bacterium]|jgi:phage shock protein PspC (stress-responsive transcriptional regulator)|nr:DUF2807 domain-containing protein [Candidatus Paceibacterota bacterium]
MKKTISISLAGSPFIIEEDAYQSLDRYLSGIRSHFEDNPDQIEVVKDIEARIAEQFIESGKNIISETEVNAVMAAMGGVEDFEDIKSKRQEGTRSEEDRTPQKVKRLYRNPDDKVVAGVASGIAAYFGIDVVWVRIAFIVFTIFDGIGILIYLILWLAIPEAKTVSQRMEMTGTPVTIETITERVKERVEEVKRDKGLKDRIFSGPFSVLKKIVSFIFTKLIPFLGTVIGIVILLISTISLFALTVVFILMVIPAGQAYFDFPISEVLSPFAIAVTSVSLYASLAIPVLFLIFFANILIRKRWSVSMPAMFALLGFWFIALVVSTVSGLVYGAEFISYTKTNPAFQEKTKIIEITAPFSAISAKNGVHVVYTQGTTTSVTLTAPERYINNTSVVSQNGVLSIKPIDKPEKFICIFCGMITPTVTVTSPSVLAFSGENGVRFEGTSAESEAMSIFLTNASRGSFETTAEKLSVKIGNGSFLELSGASTEATLSAENASAIDAKKFTADDAGVSVRNGSKTDIGETKTLEAAANNGSSIYYAGTPVLTKDAQNGSSIENAVRE